MPQHRHPLSNAYKEPFFVSPGKNMCVLFIFLLSYLCCIWYFLSGGNQGGSTTRLYSTVVRHRFVHIATFSSTLTASMSASLIDKGLLWHKIVFNQSSSQLTKERPCFWNLAIAIMVCLQWSFKARSMMRNCCFLEIFLFFKYEGWFFSLEWIQPIYMPEDL